MHNNEYCMTTIFTLFQDYMGYDRIDQFIVCDVPVSRLCSRIHKLACQIKDKPECKRIRCLSGRYHLQPERIQVMCSILEFAVCITCTCVNIIYVKVFTID